MHESKSFASLGPTLLARKGSAKPAMRPQVGHAALTVPPLKEGEDLGWNDMGDADEQDLRTRDSDVLPLTPAPHPAENGNGSARAAVANDRGAGVSVPGIPEVRRQIEAITARVARAESPAPARETREAPRQPAHGNGRRAAFTLRLDAERHLKLRLACTIKDRSAQQIVTEALDRLLSGMPELDALAAQVRRR